MTGLMNMDEWQLRAREGAIRAALDQWNMAVDRGDNFVRREAERKLERLNVPIPERPKQTCTICQEHTMETLYRYSQPLTAIGREPGFAHDTCVKRATTEFETNRRQKRMAGLIVDISGVQPKLHTTDEVDLATGKPKPRVYQGAPFTGDAVAETARAQKETTARGVVARADDPYAGMSGPEVIALAKEKGYQELPTWPNGGVRVMRARNYLRNLNKKQQKAS